MEHSDRELLYLNKGLLTILLIYLFYMRDQLSQVYFHVETVCTCSFSPLDDQRWT